MTKAEIQLVRSLADKRARTEHGLFVAEGAKLIGELCASHLRIRKIFALEGVFEGPGTETVTPREMERLTLLKTPNNSLALVEIPHSTLRISDLAGRLTLALDNVQNPGNMGTIIRLADWFGIRDIVCSEETADCFNPKVVQATMGAILRVLRRPAAPAGAGRSSRHPGLRHVSGGREHLRKPAHAGRHSGHGQRRPRHRSRRGARREPQAADPALPRRPPRLGVAERGDGHGNRVRGVPPPGPASGDRVTRRGDPLGAPSGSAAAGGIRHAGAGFAGRSAPFG